MFATIQPVQVSFPTATASTLYIGNCSVLPGSSASFSWALCADATCSPALAGGMMQLTGEAYAAWGTDDDYLYTYTAAQLGLTIVEIVPDAPPVVEPPAPVEPPADVPVVEGGV